MQVEVVRSTRRRRTVELRPTPDGVRISIPADCTAEEEARYVQKLLHNYERRRRSSQIDIAARAGTLANQYSLRRAISVRWVENQQSRWGSCTPATGEIRISSNVAAFPKWVLDYVLVHELAHLSHHGHGPAFWKLVERYPKAERARGFLIAKGLESGDDAESDDTSGANSDEIIDGPALNGDSRRPEPVVDLTSTQTPLSPSNETDMDRPLIGLDLSGLEQDERRSDTG